MLKSGPLTRLSHHGCYHVWESGWLNNPASRYKEKGWARKTKVEQFKFSTQIQQLVYKEPKITWFGDDVSFMKGITEQSESFKKMLAMTEALFIEWFWSSCFLVKLQLFPKK